MKEVIAIEIDGKPFVIGYSCMMMPTTECEVNQVYRMLRLSAHLGSEGSIFFFKSKAEKNGSIEWYLSMEHSYINLDSPEELLDLFQELPRNKVVIWDVFIGLIIKAYNLNF